jgi:hypothetical protein
MLPNNPVNPQSKQYTPSYSLRGRLEPTPPPDVLARTKYIYEVKGTGNEDHVKMWVIAARKAGPTTICTGWLVRYPRAVRGGYAVAAGPDSTIVEARQTARRSQSVAAVAPMSPSARSTRASRRSWTEWFRSHVTDGFWYPTHSRPPRRRDEASFPLAFRCKSHYNFTLPT